MRNIFLDLKIKKELKKFQEFKQNFKFELPEIETKKDGSVFVEGYCLKDGKTGEVFAEQENLIDIGFLYHGVFPKVLSNLFRYSFYFKGHKFESIEAVFQAMKIKNKSVQRKVFGYSGMVSNKVKAFADYDWKKDGIVYFQGRAMKRDSKEYDDFIDEMYVAVLQNPLYRQALKNTGNKILLHTMGLNNKNETLFTRYEFEKQINALRDFVNKN